MNYLLRHALLAAALSAVVGAGLAAPVTVAAAAPDRPAAVVPAAAAPVASRWKPRPTEYPDTVTTTDLRIRMDDGVVLRGDLIRPADAAGEAVDKKLPVIVMITAYNKTVIARGGGGLAGAGPAYLVRRGYNYLVVDARGTGSSGGTWAAFSARENKDAGKIVGWAHRQDWSNGKVGMAGASYMGISQLMAAGHHPPGLKAIFPQVPGADVYRDIVASGGQIDVGFMPLWLGLVTGTGLIPPAYVGSDPTSAIGVLIDHLVAGGQFTLPLALQALFGQSPAYDGPFYRERSAINYIDDVTVPTFLIGGEHDLFQRGTPMLFEKLQRNGAPVRMIVGPWDHLEGSSGAKVGEAGHGSLAELQLRWFDHWIKGRDGRLGEIAPVTYFEQGSDRWRTARKWVDRRKGVHTRLLSGTSMQGGKYGGLRKERGLAGESTLVPLPVSGLCTRSANQWTAGIMNQIWPTNPCLVDNNVNDYTGLTFQTRRLERPVRFRGPINARLFVSSLGGDGMLSVAVEDVAPDGTVTRLTGGWQVISQRKLVRSRSRYLDGRLIQPWHPFTKASKDPLSRGEIAPVDVEIFPTAAVIRPGHRLRFTVQGFDVPHLLAPIPDIPTQALPITLHTGPQHPSVITFPGRQKR
ncbi:CocE/NonD family hydrolase [Nocardioides antri]|uniref:CocE/NonD family hydrolase n=1 Tax=Nocardioides antri TaxID=2607659 RepID=A0A5B1M689_9ACTN|nr:CocE/NonD family hydrolase [Nocardioides antri]KAA1427639.1 CocE/NonD family hydrolase [Nocardioides antri]